MAEPGKTIIHIEIIHGKSSQVKKNLDAKDRKSMSNSAILDHFGEYGCFGDYPKYIVTIDGETREYNEANEYNPDPEN